MFVGWMGPCSPWNLMALTRVLGGSYVQNISPQQDHLHILAENSNSTLMWREAKRKGIKDKCVSNKIERKILGEKREREKHCRQQKESEGEKWEVGGQNEMLRYKNKQMHEYKMKKPDPSFPFVCAGTAPSIPSENPVPWLRITEKFRLKKISETIKSNYSSSTARATLNHALKSHLYTSFKSLQAWWLHHSPRQPFHQSVLDDSLGNEIFPNIFPKASFMELYGFHRALWIGSTSACGSVWLLQSKQGHITHSTIPS